MTCKKHPTAATPLSATARHLSDWARFDAPRLSDADLTALLVASTRAQHAAYREMARRRLIKPTTNL